MSEKIEPVENTVSQCNICGRKVPEFMKMRHARHHKDAYYEVGKDLTKLYTTVTSTGNNRLHQPSGAVIMVQTLPTCKICSLPIPPSMKEEHFKKLHPQEYGAAISANYA
jgi:hypothetical protein